MSSTLNEVLRRVRHSRMLLAGIQAESGLDPRLKHSGVTILESPLFCPSRNFRRRVRRFVNESRRLLSSFLRLERLELFDRFEGLLPPQLTQCLLPFRRFFIVLIGVEACLGIPALEAEIFLWRGTFE